MDKYWSVVPGLGTPALESTKFFFFEPWDELLNIHETCTKTIHFHCLLKETNSVQPTLMNLTVSQPEFYKALCHTKGTGLLQNTIYFYLFFIQLKIHKAWETHRRTKILVLKDLGQIRLANILVLDSQLGYGYGHKMTWLPES